MTIRRSRIFAKARPGALPMPGDRHVSAFTKSDVLSRWCEEASGIRAVATGDNIITMFGTIGEDYWSESGGITAKKVSAQLRAIGDRPVEVHINSGGGDMFEGIAIYNVLREHPQAITIKIMGMAASAASIIAMAGDVIAVGAASFVMIHNCWVVAIGNRHDMAETSTWLEPFDQALADVYAARTGNDIVPVKGWMDDETYMSGSTAIERGFADELLAADAVKEDEGAKAEEKRVNEVRAIELTLVNAGISRSDARARINKIKGTPGAAREDDTTPGAGVDTELLGGLAGLLETIRA